MAKKGSHISRRKSLRKGRTSTAEWRDGKLVDKATGERVPGVPEVPKPKAVVPMTAAEKLRQRRLNS